MSAAQQNLYEFIGLSQDASQDLIDEQCIRLGERYRPDKNSGDLRRALIFAQIEKAYETLGDPIKRAAYDAELLRQRAKTIKQEFPPLFVEPTPNKELNAVRSGKTTHADLQSRNEFPSASTPAVESVERRYPVEFTASAGEYFRIWIVNLGLTILTLGIYSAWAKVRKKRYFYGHTRIDGDSFEYRGNPIAILKGRLIAVGAVAVFYGAAQFYPSLLWVLVPAAVLIVPWLIVRSFAFNAYNTAYRNLHLHFRGAYGKCLRLLLAYGLLAVVTAGIGLFYLRVRLTEFVIRNHYFGATQFRLMIADLKPIFFRIWSKAIGLGFLLGIVLAALAVATGGLDEKSTDPSIIIVLASYLGYLMIYAYIRARIANATWNNVALGSLRFECALRARDVSALYVTNILAILVTLGLATPWAVVRMLRYRTAKTTLIAAGGLAGFVRTESSQVGAAGEEVAEMFDFDLSI